MKPETIAILTNRDVIAVDQDKAGHQGDRVAAEGYLEIWDKPLADGSKAVGIFNRGPSPWTAHPDFRPMGFAAKVKARDLWAGKDLGALDANYAVTVPAHGVVLLRVSQ
jgi:alpha-galactosidase